MTFEELEISRQTYEDKIDEVKDLRERAELYSEYKKAYKAYFVNYQLQSFFTDIKYDHTLGIDAATLRRTGLIDTGDTYYSNDLINAQYKNINFTQADVEIIRKYEGQANEEYNPLAINKRSEIVFKGRFLIFKFSKKILHRVAILPVGAPSFFIDPVVRTGLKPVETESALFNRMFKIYAEDGFEAFYILDPAFIESVEHFADRYCHKVVLYFMHDKMFIGINDGDDSFEPPDPALPINENRERAKIIEDMKLVTDIVGVLDLL